MPHQSSGPNTSLNWPGGSQTGGLSRADTLQQNASDSATIFQFEDQSDALPQTLTPVGSIHRILQGPNGTVDHFPDHMHEGEVVTPASLTDTLLLSGQPFAEYPAIGANQPAPRVIATGSFVEGHETVVDSNKTRCTQSNFVTDTTPTPTGTIGIVCVYDGRPVGVGRVVTDSSFHHYLDLNLIGDPCGSTPDRVEGFRGGNAPYTPPVPGSVLADLQSFYVNTVLWLARPVQDCQLVLDKSTYGEDEVKLNAAYDTACMVQVDGCSANDLGLTPDNLSNPPANRLPTIVRTFDPTLSGAQFASLQSMLQVKPLISSAQPVVPVAPLDANNLGQPQTFFYPVAVTFNGTNGFDQLGAGNATQVEVSASITTTDGVTVGNSAEITLTTAEDPFLTDVSSSDPTQPSWLSFDLRFFKMTLAPNTTTTLFNAATTIGTDPTDPITGAPAFITDVISQLNTNNAAVGGDAWFAGLTTTEDATKLEFQRQDNSHNYVFNFAVARVRLDASSAATAKQVRIFFRLFQAQNTVSNFDTATTYRFADGPLYGHKVPLLGVQNDQNGNPEYVTIPCFAAPRINVAGAADMHNQFDDANAFDITTAGGGETLRYFACWVDINQPQQTFLPASPSSIASGESMDGPWTAEWQQNPSPLQSIQTAITAAPHQCLVAEIRFDDTPIPAGATTGTSDKLAQRNIAWLDGPNPGAAASRRMPHPIQLRPTPAKATNPDELMILWGNTPKASEAQLYLPALDAADIISLADRRYASHRLRLVDGHTVGCPAQDATLIPLPKGAALAAGLLSVDLPLGIRKGDAYDIEIRQLTDAAATLQPPPATIQIAAQPRAQAAAATPIAWRQVIGGCQLAIRISTKEQLLLPEERLLALLRWIAQEMPHNKRWYPVMLRYIDDIAGRVQGFGGNPTTITPSPTGQVPGWHLPQPAPGGGGGHGHGHHPFTGKVDGIVYDHFGDFEGFILTLESGPLHRFSSREDAVLRVVRAALEERARVTVFAERHRPHEPRQIVVHAGRRHP